MGDNVELPEGFSPPPGLEHLISLDRHDHTIKHRKLSEDFSADLSDFVDASTVAGSSFFSAGGDTAVEVGSDDELDRVDGAKARAHTCGTELRLAKLIDGDGERVKARTHTCGTELRLDKLVDDYGERVKARTHTCSTELRLDELVDDNAVSNPSSNLNMLPIPFVSSSTVTIAWQQLYGCGKPRASSFAHVVKPRAASHF